MSNYNCQNKNQSQNNWKIKINPSKNKKKIKILCQEAVKTNNNYHQEDHQEQNQIKNNDYLNINYDIIIYYKHYLLTKI